MSLACGFPGPARRGASVPASSVFDVAPVSYPLTAMADIPALVASIDARLDQLAAQIHTLQDARTALQAQTPIAAPVPPKVSGAAAKRTRRPPSQTTKPATARARPAPRSALPTISEASATGDETKVPKPRRRAATTGTRGNRSGSSLSAEQLHRPSPTLGRVSARARSPSTPAPATTRCSPSCASWSPREPCGGPAVDARPGGC